VDDPDDLVPPPVTHWPAGGQRRSRASLVHRGLLFWFGASATSDAEKKVLTGGELTVIEAVDPRVW